MQKLVLGPRPKLKKVAGRSENVIFTLLTKREEAQDVGLAARAGGKDWFWHPLSVRKQDFSPWEAWVSAVDELELCLKAKKMVYLHCAAGIHRTGCITYLLFRKWGLTPENAQKLVFDLRPIIKDQINTKMFDIEAMLQENGGF